MASDPFHTFASSVRSSLGSARDLAHQYSTALESRSGSDEILLAHDRLSDSLEALKTDLEDVKQSIAVVKRSPERFGVETSELERREDFLKTCEQEVRTLEAVARKGQKPKGRQGTYAVDMNGSRGDEEGEEDHNAAFEREQQQMIMTQQDSTLTAIGRTLTNLQSQASTMGHEIAEQVDIIGALDTEVDQSQTKLGRAMGKMDEMIRRGDDRMGGWCVWILILLLFFLLLIVVII